MWWRRNRKISIEPFGDDPVRSMPSPSMTTSAINYRSALIVAMIAMIAILMVANILIARTALSRAAGIAYVADGTRFSCEIPTVAATELDL